MSKIRVFALSLILSAPAYSLHAQDFSVPDPESEKVWEANAAAAQACQNKEIGAACSLENPFTNTTMSGTCKDMKETVGFGTEVDTGVACSE